MNIWDCVKHMIEITVNTIKLFVFEKGKTDQLLVDKSNNCSKNENKICGQ